jgi:hypothetical protein
MVNTLTKYTEERAELLAKLILTRRKDLQVVSFADREELGIDMIVRILQAGADEQMVSPYFAAQILGTSDLLEDEDAATKFANRNGKHRPTQMLWLCPILVLLFTVERDVGYYAWLLKPDVSAKEGPSLTRVQSLSMKKLSNKTVDEIIRQVRDWFEAMRELLGKHASEKKG